MNKELEEKWREEFEKYWKEDFNGSECFMFGEYAEPVYLTEGIQETWLCYLAARKKAQEEIEEWKDTQKSLHEAFDQKLEEQSGEIVRLRMENERLNNFCKEFVYGEENPEYYRTMDEELEKRDKLIKQAKYHVRKSHFSYCFEKAGCVCEADKWIKEVEGLK